MGSVKILTVATLLLCGSMSAVHGQNWDEVFSQKKTQIRYLAQQIAALQVYIGYARKGYELSGKGMDLVRGFSGGEQALHKGFFSALSLVSPHIRGSSSVERILALQAGVLLASKHWNIPLMNSSEQIYLREVKSSLLSLCLQDLESLAVLLGNNRLALTEDQRLARVSELLVRMTEKYSFAINMSAKVRLLLNARSQQSGEAGRLGELNGINLNQ
jgi:hypothetical protein